MGSCYLGDHSAEDHIHTYITTYNIEEPQQKYRDGTVINRLLVVCVCVGGGLKHVFIGFKSRLLPLQWFGTFCPHKGFLSHNPYI